MTNIKGWLKEAYFILILKLFVPCFTIQITSRNLPNSCFEKIQCTFSAFVGRLEVYK